MATVLNRTTKQLLVSVNTPDYSTATWIINPNLSAVVGVPVEYWKITGDVVSEMDASEKAAVDAVLIVGEKQAKIDEFFFVSTQLVDSKYAPSTMSEFSVLLAQAGGLPNRAAYIQQLFTWVAAANTGYVNHTATVNAQSTRAGVAAVTWDTTALEAANPLVTVNGALAILT